MDLGDRECNEQILNYFFNQTSGNCEVLYFSGCGGNGNRFETVEQCQRQCGANKGLGMFFFLLDFYSSSLFSLKNCTYLDE